MHVKQRRDGQERQDCLPDRSVAAARLVAWAVIITALRSALAWQDAEQLAGTPQPMVNLDM